MSKIVCCRRCNDTGIEGAGNVVFQFLQDMMSSGAASVPEGPACPNCPCGAYMRSLQDAADAPRIAV